MIGNRRDRRFGHQVKPGGRPPGAQVQEVNAVLEHEEAKIGVIEPVPGDLAVKFLERMPGFARR
jgi:hypothetical protein